MDLHIFMKLGREITSREVVESQLYPIYHNNPKPVGTVLPFRSPYDNLEAIGNVTLLEKLRLLHKYTEDCPFRYLYYNAMESTRYIDHRKLLLTRSNNPELCSRSVSPPVDMRLMISLTMASRLMKDEDIWIGQERISRYDQFTEAATLRGVISVSLGHKRIKKMVVSLHPTYLFLFRERGVSLVLREEILRANILLVTYDFQGPPRHEVGVCWKSPSTEPTTMAYMKLVFNDSTEAKVWASCLAPKDVPYELIAECLEDDFVPKFSNIDGGSGTRLAGAQAPAGESSLQDVTMDQVQRLLSRIKKPDLDLLNYRVVALSKGLEAVVIQNPHTEASYSAIDIMVDGIPSSLKANKLPSGDTEEASSDFQYYFLDKSNWDEFNIVEYLEACYGSWHLAEDPSHKTCYVEVPNKATIENTFRGAVNRLIYGFLCATTNTQHDQFDQVENRLGSIKLMVYSRESLNELELWVREAVTRFQSAEYLGLN